MCFDFFMRRHQILGGNKFQAIINVSYTEGAICTCSLDDITLIASNTSGTAVFTVTKPGTWTITATIQDSVSTTTVVVKDVNKAVYSASLEVDGFEYTFACEDIGVVCTATLGDITYTNTSNVNNIISIDGKIYYIITYKLYTLGNWALTATYDGDIWNSYYNLTIDMLNGSGTDIITFAPTVSTSPKSGIAYITDLSGISWSKMSEYAKLISKNPSITNTTVDVYIDEGAKHYKLSAGSTKTVQFVYSGNTYTIPHTIVGFNHDTVSNPSSYGASKAGISLCATESVFTGITYGTSIWESSNIRAYLQTTFYNGYETELKNSMVNVEKQTCAYRSGTSYSASMTSDDIFLLSFKEYGHSAASSGSSGGGLGLSPIGSNPPVEGATYIYFKNGGTYNIPSNGLMTRTWEGSYFAITSTSGFKMPVATATNIPFSPALCI